MYATTGWLTFHMGEPDSAEKLLPWLTELVKEYVEDGVLSSTTLVRVMIDDPTTVEVFLKKSRVLNVRTYSTTWSRNNMFSSIYYSGNTDMENVARNIVHFFDSVGMFVAYGVDD